MKIKLFGRIMLLSFGSYGGLVWAGAGAFAGMEVEQKLRCNSDTERFIGCFTATYNQKNIFGPNIILELAKNSTLTKNELNFIKKKL